MASICLPILTSSPIKQFTAYNMSSSPLPSPREILKPKASAIPTGICETLMSQNATASFTTTTSRLQNSSLKDLKSVEAIRPPKQVSASNTSEYFDQPKPAKPRTKRVATNGTTAEESKGVKPPRKAVTKKEVGDKDKTEIKKPRKPRVKKVNADIGEGGAGKTVAPRKASAKKAEKARIDPDATESGELKASTPKKPRAKNVNKDKAKNNAEDETPKEKTAKKSRAKKTHGDAQTKILGGRVTKPSTNFKKTVRVAESMVESALAEPLEPFVDSIDYGLVKASKRRSDWTPPSASANILILPDTLFPNEAIGSPKSPAVTSSKGFIDLFGSYSFTRSESNTTARQVLDGGTRKRKLIELIQNTVSAPAATTIPKAKAPKKKARTITDQATSAYAEGAATAGQPEPLLQYFSYQTTERTTSDELRIPSKPRSKISTKKFAKGDKGTVQAPILLSPESALKQVGDQLFVYGTSSQLAREESPTLLRDLQEAMEASNKLDDDDLFADIIDEPSVSATFRPRGITSLSNKRVLWSAGARNAGGDLSDIEMIDMVDSPQVVLSHKPAAALQDEWHEIGDTTPLAPRASTSKKMTAKTVGPVEVAVRMELSSSPPRGSMTKIQSPKRPKVIIPTDVPLSSKPTVRRSIAKVTQKPDFKAYTTAQLAKELASYHFKPIKNRDTMITLLEKCWEGKNSIALDGPSTTNPPSPVKISKNALQPPSEMETQSPKRGRQLKDATSMMVSSETSKNKKPLPSSQLNTLKKPQGRPRKDSTSMVLSPIEIAKPSRPKKMDNVKYLEIDSDTPLSQTRTPKGSRKMTSQNIEIYDSDSQVTPSPPRRFSQIQTPPLPLKDSVADEDDETSLTPASIQVSLFKHITQAVKNMLPSKDPKNPTWQEKILLYDPLVLEDLAVWLNTGALEKVGWDGEVTPKEVKNWCESKSICCLWKENLNGGARSRY